MTTAGAPIRVSADIRETEWDAYVEAHPRATVDHLWRWQQVFDGVFGHRCRYLAARRDGALAGVLPLVLFQSRLFGRSVVSVPFLNYGGMLCDAGDAEAASSLLAAAGEIAREFKAEFVELRNRDREFPELPFRQHKLALTRLLPSTAEALWSAIDRKVRNQVRKAQKEGLTAEVGGAPLVGEFYGVFAANMRDLGTPVYSRRLFQATLTAFPERARLVVVRQGARPIAASVTLRFRDTVIVPWASSLREYRHLVPNMLLYWTMLEEAVKEGVKTFDFGRSSPGAGTHQFKLQWGAVESPLHWEYILMGDRPAPDHGPTNPKFARVIELWKRLPLPVANAIGPLIVRHIP